MKKYNKQFKIYGINETEEYSGFTRIDTTESMLAEILKTVKRIEMKMPDKKEPQIDQ